MVEATRALAEDIQTLAPDAEVDFTTFPSGAATIDVCLGGRLFILSYSPSRHFGVDEVTDESAFQTGYRFTSESFEQAADHLRSLIASAAVGKQAATR